MRDRLKTEERSRGDKNEGIHIRDISVVKFYRYVFRKHFYYGKISSIHKTRENPQIPSFNSDQVTAGLLFLIYILPYPILLIILNSVSISNINGYFKTIQYMIIPKKIAVA